MEGFSVELESATPLFPAASEIETARFSVVSGVASGRTVTAMTVAVVVTVVIDVVAIVSGSESYLACAVAVRMSGDRWTRVGMRVTQAVCVDRR